MNIGKWYKECFNNRAHSDSYVELISYESQDAHAVEKGDLEDILHDGLG